MAWSVPLLHLVEPMWKCRNRCGRECGGRSASTAASHRAGLIDELFDERRATASLADAALG